jgi:hypothetical protein
MRFRSEELANTWCRRGGGGDPIRCVHPPALSPLLRRWLRRHGGAGRMCCPGVRAETFVCVCDRWKMVYPMLGLWMEAGSSDIIPRHCSHGGVSVLEFDRVSEDMLPRSDSFNDNGFASSKLLWRSEKLLISDGAALSLVLWWSVFRPFGVRFGGVEGGG